jgi:DNA-binding MarR family transcriptional regulator
MAASCRDAVSRGIYKRCYICSVSTPEGSGPSLRAALDAMESGMADALVDLGLRDYRPRFSGVVRVLAEAGPSSIGALAEATGVTHSAASQTVNELRLRGLVTLERGTDGRRRMVSLAPEARELLPVIEAEWDASAAAIASLDNELPVPLQTFATELAAALERRSFRQRIADAAAFSEGGPMAAYREPLATPRGPA